MLNPCKIFLEKIQEICVEFEKGDVLPFYDNQVERILQFVENLSKEKIEHSKNETNKIVTKYLTSNETKMEFLKKFPLIGEKYSKNLVCYFILILILILFYF